MTDRNSVPIIARWQRTKCQIVDVRHDMLSSEARWHDPTPLAEAKVVFACMVIGIDGKGGAAQVRLNHHLDASVRLAGHARMAVPLGL
jgi:hypothetical protein